ncbi:MAG: glycosyltransferase [Candidatus Omnitrophica bacterium]|nr:glycosyltransferase [Candidatus Omnitrophota bacterium]
MSELGGMKRVLIFYVSRNSGHYNAAKSIEKAILGFGKGIEIRTVNALDYANPILGKILAKAYAEILKKRPQFWGNIYDNPVVLEKTRKTRERFAKRGFPKIQKLVGSFKPGAVVCTQAYPSGLMAYYKRRSGDKIPLIAVLTDHAPHSYWIFPETDIYVVPSDDTAAMMVKKGVPREKIRVLGIPVDNKFQNSHDRSLLRDRFALYPGKRTVLIMGGNQGLGALEEIVDAFQGRGGLNYQLMVVAGRNKRLYRRIKNRYMKGNGGNIKLYPYSENIDEMMEASDAIITKAGGITTAEALAKGVPIFIVDPIPGQERMNTDFLVKEGAAVEIKNKEALIEAVNSLFDTKGALEKMAANSKRISKADSSTRVAELVIRGC